MALTELRAGQTIPAGTLVLLTSGDYSSYSVIGLFRAATDVVVPAKPLAYRRVAGITFDIADVTALSLLLEEVPCAEVHRDDE